MPFYYESPKVNWLQIKMEATLDLYTSQINENEQGITWKHHKKLFYAGTKTYNIITIVYLTTV